MVESMCQVVANQFLASPPTYGTYVCGLKEWENGGVSGKVDFCH